MGNPNFIPPPESMSHETSALKFAQVIALPTLSIVGYDYSTPIAPMNA